MSIDDVMYAITLASTEKDKSKARKRAVAAIERYFKEKGEYRVGEQWADLWKGLA